MLHWGSISFLLAAITAVLGFSCIALEAANLFKILFYCFLGLFIASLVTGVLRGHS